MPDREVAELQNTRFSTARRGYDRDEVDRYMSRVNTLLAELQITAAPEYAIEAAVESVQDERRAVIAGARQEAEEITRRSRAQADDRIEEARQEAQKLREAAARENHGSRAATESRIRELEADVQAIAEQRESAVQELEALARSLEELLAGQGRNGAAGLEPARADAVG